MYFYQYTDLSILERCLKQKGVFFLPRTRPEGRPSRGLFTTWLNTMVEFLRLIVHAPWYPEVSRTKAEFEP